MSEEEDSKASFSAPPKQGFGRCHDIPNEMEGVAEEGRYSWHTILLNKGIVIAIMRCTVVYSK